MSSDNDGDAADAQQAHPPRKLHNLAFGIEKIGLISLRAPMLSLAILAVLAIGAAFGVARIQVDDSLSQLFRSDSPEFRQFEEVTQRFPSSEFDVLIVVEGEQLMARDTIIALSNLVLDLQLIEGPRGIISLFSARTPPQPGGVPGPLFPDPLPQGAEYDALVQTVLANEILRGKLLSEDGTLTLIVLALEPAIVGTDQLNDVVADIHYWMDTDLGGTGVTAQLSGVPIMQLEIRNAVERDRLIYNAFGFFAGCLIAIIFFRRVSFMIIAAAPPLIAILLALGALGWLDFQLNMFLNVMTPLIMVISFADSMQLTFAARDRLLAGENKYQAFRNAVLVVGPACVLTHCTAGLSFVALQFSSSNLIRTFGEAGLTATVIALFGVLMLVPLLGVLLIRNEAIFAEKVRTSDAGVNALRRFCGWVARRMVSHPGLYTLIAVLFVGSLAGVYATLEPRYRLADQVPDREQAVEASSRLDEKLTGANPIDVLVQFPPDTDLYAESTLDIIGTVHDVMEAQAGVGNVWSPETLRRWLREKVGTTDVEVLKQYVNYLPEHLTRRFVSAEEDAVVVSGRIPDIDSSELLPRIDALDAALQPLRDANPGFTISVTGLAAIAARNSADMIGKLNRALTVEIVFVAAFIGLAFRSFAVMIASIMPGIFPVVLSGTVLFFLGDGLNFAAVVALIVSFGLGLSATIHFLNRLRLEDRPEADPGLGVERATVLVGPALILTSVVLACGLAVTVLSDLPSLRTFGWLAAFSMMAALVADLLILRPTAMFLYSLGRRFSRRPPPSPPSPQAAE